jgi:hypothetical protein
MGGRSDFGGWCKRAELIGKSFSMGMFLLGLVACAGTSSQALRDEPLKAVPAQQSAGPLSLHLAMDRRQGAGSTATRADAALRPNSEAAFAAQPRPVIMGSVQRERAAAREPMRLVPVVAAGAGPAPSVPAGVSARAVEGGEQEAQGGSESSSAPPSPDVFDLPPIDAQTVRVWDLPEETVVPGPVALTNEVGEEFEELLQKRFEGTSVPPSQVQDGEAFETPKSTLLGSENTETAPVNGAPPAFVDFVNSGTGEPPDPDMAAGLSYIVTDYNSFFRIYDKSGVKQGVDYGFTSFWSGLTNCGSASSSVCDPQMVYDDENDRFVFTALAVNGSNSYICLAATQSGDPRGTWNRYEILPAAGNVYDYPHTAVGEDAIFVSTNLFSGGTTYSGTTLLAIQKSSAYAGTAITPRVATLGTGSTGPYTNRPAVRRGYNQGQYPPSGKPHYFFSTNNADNTTIIVQWPQPTFTSSPAQVAGWSDASPGNPVQPADASYISGGVGLDPLGSKVMDAELRWPYAWFTRTGGSGGYDVIRWAEVDLSAATPTTIQSGTYGLTNNHLFLPDCTVDKNNSFAVVMTRASATGPVYVGAYITGHDSAGGSPTPTGQLEALQAEKAGEGVYVGYNQSGRVRWGDYQGCQIDPNGCDIWTVGEFSQSNSNTYKDATYVTKFSFASCTPGATRLATLNKAIYQCHQTVGATITDTGGAPSNAIYHSTSGGPYPAAISGGPTTYTVSTVTTDQLGAVDGDDIWLTFTGSDAASYSSAHSKLSCGINVCVSSVDPLTGGCDNDAYMDQGETLNVFVHMKNNAAYGLPTGFYADLVVDPSYPDSNVTIVNGTAEWAALTSGDDEIPAGKTFQVRYTGAYATFCKVLEHFQVVNIRATDGSWVGGAGCSAGSDKFTELANANDVAPLVAESFDGTTWPPTGWTLSPNITGTATWARVTSGTDPTATPHTGAGMAYFNSYLYTSGAQARLVTPAFSLVGAPSPTVTFWMYHSGTYTYADTIAVQVSTTSATSGFKTVATFTRNVPSTLEWLKHSVDLSAYAGQPTVYVGFLATSAYGLNMYMDDVTVASGTTVCQASACMSAPVLVSNDGDWVFDDSQCNGNGYPDAKESGLLTLYLANTGNDTAYGVQATLSCPACPADVTICKSTATYGDIPYGTGYVYGPGGNGFEIKLPSGITPDADLPFVVTCTTTNSPAYNPVINVIPSPHSLQSLRDGTPTLQPGAGSTTHTWQDGFTTAPGTPGTGGRIPTSGGSPTWASTAWTTVGDVSSSTTQSADGDGSSARLRVSASASTSSMARTFSTSGYDNDMLFYFLLYIPVTNTTFTMAYSPDNGTNWYTIISIPAGAVTTAGWYYFGPYSLYWTIYDGTGTGFGPAAANAILNNSKFNLRFQVVKGAGGNANWYVDGFWIANYKYVNTATTCGGVCNPPDAPGITQILDNNPCAQDGIRVFYDSAIAATSYDLLKDGTPVVLGYVSGTLYNPGDTASHGYVIRANNSYGSTSSASVPFADTATTGTPTIACTPGSCTSSSSVSLTTETGFSNYQWYLNGGIIGGATSSGYSAAVSGNYTVSYKIGACSNTSVTKAVTISGALPKRVPYSVTPTTATTANQGADMTVHWDTGTCTSTDYHIIYGKGENIASLAGSSPVVDGGKCAIGTSGTYGWTGVPDPSSYTSRYLWFLVVGDNGGTTEGSWGLTSAGDERGGTAASAACSMSTKDVSSACGTP